MGLLQDVLGMMQDQGAPSSMFPPFQPAPNFGPGGAPEAPSSAFPPFQMAPNFGPSGAPDGPQSMMPPFRPAPNFGPTGAPDGPQSAIPPFQLAPGQDPQPDFGRGGVPMPAARPAGADFPGGNVPTPQPRPAAADAGPAIPIPRPRPPGAGPGMASAPAGMATDDGSSGAPMALPGAPPPGGTGSGGGGLMAALGLNNPETLRSAVAALGGGLKNVKNSPFPGEVFSQAAGGGIEAGGKQDQQTYTDKLQALDRALKLQQIKQLGSYRDDMADAKFGGLNIAQQRADQTGTYNNGRLVLGGQLNGIRQQNADTRSDIAPSTIRRNETAADLNTAKADPNIPPEKRLTTADKATDTWYRDRVAPLRDELRSINQSQQPAEAKTQQYNSVQQRLRDLDIERANIKTQNRREHGLNEDGSDARPGKQSAAPAGGTMMAQSAPTSVSQNRPGKSVMGTRDDPHMPQTQADFDAIQPGQIFRDPGDGQLKEK